MDREMVEDLKEISSCGMTIHYTVDTETDFVTYTDINGRGEHRPTACNYMGIIQEHLGRAVNPLDVITQIYEQAAAGYESEIITDGDGKTVLRVTKQPYRWEDKNGGKREI